MKIIANCLPGCLLLFCLIVPAFPSLAAEPPQGESIRELAAQLQEQNSQTSRDLRRIHRELAALRAELAKPGLSEIFGGIGYIFGLFGVAAFVLSRRQN
ncbi:MAG: hypothetical protein ACOC9D_06640 [Thermodesulfobacteriota bacterium]